MHLSRIVVRNFRNFLKLEATLHKTVTCVSGENNSGKSNLLYALRLLLDSKLSGASRRLSEQDFHCSLNIGAPTQIVIAAELSEASAGIQLAFSGVSPLSGSPPMMAYRFRPGQNARENVDPDTKQYTGGPLAIEDYEYELVLCSDNDPAEVSWFEPLGKQMYATQLQEFTVEYLPALRNVEDDLRAIRTSPLAKLLGASDISSEDRATIEEEFVTANAALRSIPAVQNVANSMQHEFVRLAGRLSGLTVELGVADPSFAQIARTLTVLFDAGPVGTVDLSRNGLGVNNLLYTSMIADYFRRRVTTGVTPGQLFMVDEPEAHLHPQAQRVLYSALAGAGFQTIVATHSTHITSHAPLITQVNLARNGSATEGRDLVAGLTPEEVADLDRYLDATRSTMLFCRHVILVEGPAELFLIPPLAKSVMGIDLDRELVSIVPIFGTHFRPFGKLLESQTGERRCAIIADGDLRPEEDAEDEFDAAIAGFGAAPDGRLVRNFRNRTTFERALAIHGLLPALVATFEELDHPRIASRFRDALQTQPSEFDAVGEDSKFGGDILKAAVRHGKGRFAQVLSKHAHLATDVPGYIRDAIEWVIGATADVTG